jgi:hypothetical protein
MPVETYRLLHVAGVMMLFLGIGGILATEPGKGPKLFPILHGLGLLVMLVAGIGVVHKQPYEWHPWVLAKIACWIVLGALPVLVKRGVLPRLAALVLALAIGATAAWLALQKPF